MAIIEYPKYNREDKLCSKLSDKQVEEIKSMYNTGKYTQRSLGKIFSVAHSTIGNILNPEIKRLLNKKYREDCRYPINQEKIILTSKKTQKRKRILMKKEMNIFHYKYLKESGYYNRPDVIERRRINSLKYYYEKIKNN